MNYNGKWIDYPIKTNKCLFTWWISNIIMIVKFHIWDGGADAGQEEQRMQE